MNIINCTECGKVCLASPSGQCPDCQQTLRQYEEKIHRYLERRQNSSLTEICSATGAPRPIIMQMIKSGRLEPCSVDYPCEGCQEPITKGRICVRCADNVISLEPGRRLGANLKPSCAGDKPPAPVRIETSPSTPARPAKPAPATGRLLTEGRKGW